VTLQTFASEFNSADCSFLFVFHVLIFWQPVLLAQGWRGWEGWALVRAAAFRSLVLKFVTRCLSQHETYVQNFYESYVVLC